MKTISIALCTYNGSKFLRAQLQSLATQTLLPTEIIITDDCSGDDTITIVKEFEKRLPIKFLVNDVPLKVTKNFEKAVALCSGEIICLCDQDDVWHNHKLAEIHHYFEQHPHDLAVFSNAELVDENAQSIQKTFWSVVRFDAQQRTIWSNGNAIEVLLAGNRVAGCMMAFKKELLPYIMPFPMDIPDIIHDSWITLVAAMFGKMGFIETSLISYRQHAYQQIGTRPKKTIKAISLQERFSRPRAEKVAPLLEKQVFFERLQAMLQQRLAVNSNPIVAENFKKIQQKIDFYEIRANLSPFHLGRILPIAKLLFNGSYQKYKDQEASWKAPYIAALGDLIE